MKEVVLVRLLSKYMLFLILLLSFTFIKVDALSLDKNEISIVKGQSDSINLSVNVTEEIKSIDFNLIFSSYDVPAKFIVNENYSLTTSGISNKVSFDAPVSGNIDLGSIEMSVVPSPQLSAAYINLTNAKATTSNGNVITLNSNTINVNILNETVSSDEKTTEKVETTGSTILESIESEIVNIKVKKDVYEYNVTVSEDIKELDLKPIITDESYKVNISSQKIDSNKNNKITITLTNNSEKVVYTVNVKVNKKVTIDESEAPTYSYKGKWIIVAGIFVVVLFSGLYISKNRD